MRDVAVIDLKTFENCTAVQGKAAGGFSKIVAQSITQKFLGGGTFMNFWTIF